MQSKFYVVLTEKCVNDDRESGILRNFFFVSRDDARNAMFNTLNETKRDLDDNINDLDTDCRLDSCSLSVNNEDTYEWSVVEITEAPSFAK